jgi:hypothetical protein
MAEIRFIIEDTPLSQVQKVIGELETKGKLVVYSFSGFGDVFSLYKTNRLPNLLSILEEKGIKAREITNEGINEFLNGFALGVKQTEKAYKKK